LLHAARQRVGVLVGMTTQSGGSVERGQMVCVEFTTRAGRGIRLLGCLAEATEDHLLIEAIEGSATRPSVGESVSVSTLIGRNVQQAATTVLMSGDGRSRLMLRRPLAFLPGNRRRHDRVSTRLPMEWFAVEHGPREARSGHTVDLSIAGLQMATTAGDAVASGERIVVVIELPARHVPAVCEVRSWRDDAGGARIGVEFVALSDLDRAALAHLMS
jgi:PilZ domain-containing protein